MNWEREVRRRRSFAAAIEHANMNIALYGYGKMGAAIERAAQARGHSIILRVDQANAATPPMGADLAIEFSNPASAMANMRLCLEHGVPVVVGTTGWYDHIGEVEAMVEATKGTLLWSSNFSIGVNLFFKLNKFLTGLMNGQPGYAARIEEVHHVHKLDAPSGTAITLARDLAGQSDRYKHWGLEEEGVEMQQGLIPVHSERTGEVPGTHRIQWQSAEDRITITHEAFGRQGFATGAVVAAEWLLGRTGLFTMEDVLAGKP